MADRLECSATNNVPERAYNLPARCRQRRATRVIASWSVTLYGALQGSFPRPMWPRRASAYDLLASEIASAIAHDHSTTARSSTGISSPITPRFLC